MLSIEGLNPDVRIYPLYPCPAERRYVIFLKTLQILISWFLTKPSDQNPVFYSACMLITEMLQVNGVKIGEECIHKNIQHNKD